MSSTLVQSRSHSPSLTATATASLTAPSSPLITFASTAPSTSRCTSTPSLSAMSSSSTSSFTSLSSSACSCDTYSDPSPHTNTTRINKRITILPSSSSSSSLTTTTSTIASSSTSCCANTLSSSSSSSSSSPLSSLSSSLSSSSSSLTPSLTSNQTGSSSASSLLRLETTKTKAKTKAQEEEEAKMLDVDIDVDADVDIDHNDDKNDDEMKTKSDAASFFGLFHHRRLSVHSLVSFFFSLTAFIYRSIIQNSRRLSILLLIVLFVFITVKAIIESVKQGYFDPDVKDKLMVVYSTPEDKIFGLTHAQGAFSDFISVIGALMYGIHHGAAGVRFILDNPIYEDVNPEQGRYSNNYFDYFYQSHDAIFNTNIQNPEEIHYTQVLSQYGRFGSFSRYMFVPKSVNPDPFPVALPFSRTEINQVLTKYVKPKEFITQEVSSFISRNFPPSPTFVIGLHFRGSDKVLIYPYRSPSYAVYDFYIEQVVKRYLSIEDQKNRKFHIHIATDSNQFIDYMNKKYKGQISSIEAPRADANDVRGLHKLPGVSPFVKGLSAVMDVLLLSRTNYIIKNRSSLSDCALMWNPSVNFTLFYGEEDPVWSTDNLPRPPDYLWNKQV